MLNILDYVFINQYIFNLKFSATPHPLIVNQKRKEVDFAILFSNETSLKINKASRSPVFFISTSIPQIVNLGETLEGSAEPENPPTLSLNDTVRTKRWLVEGSAPKNASLKVHNLKDSQILFYRNDRVGE